MLAFAVKVAFEIELKEESLELRVTRDFAYLPSGMETDFLANLRTNPSRARQLSIFYEAHAYIISASVLDELKSRTEGVVHVIPAGDNPITAFINDKQQAERIIKLTQDAYMPKSIIT